MKSIERVVLECDIAKKRERMIQNQKDMLMVKNMMSHLTLHKNVAQYAYCLDYDDYYRKKKELTPEEEKKCYEGRIQMALLVDDPHVTVYRELKDEYDRMERECREYYQTIQIPFREALKDTDLPNIFVYQGMLDRKSKLKLSRHIILGELHEAYKSTPSIVIYPVKDLYSKREFRHFYNHVSFKYLEQMSQDYRSDVKTKKLGKVIVRYGEDIS